MSDAIIDARDVYAKLKKLADFVREETADVRRLLPASPKADQSLSATAFSMENLLQPLNDLQSSKDYEGYFQHQLQRRLILENQLKTAMIATGRPFVEHDDNETGRRAFINATERVLGLPVEISRLTNGRSREHRTYFSTHPKAYEALNALHDAYEKGIKEVGLEGLAREIGGNSPSR